MKTAKASILKPCPFCGGLATIQKIYKPAISYWIECTQCLAAIVSYKTKWQAIQEWNKRVK